MGRVHADGAQASLGAPPGKASQGLRGGADGGESAEELDLIAEVDQLRAERGLLPVMGQGGKIFYKHIDALSRLDMHVRSAAEWVEVAWLKERVECRKKGAEAPTIPHHLR